jgi:hypothetical protein
LPTLQGGVQGFIATQVSASRPRASGAWTTPWCMVRGRFRHAPARSPGRRSVDLHQNQRLFARCAGEPSVTPG